MTKQTLRGRTNLSALANLLFPTRHLSGNRGCNNISGESVQSPETFCRTREVPFEFHFVVSGARRARWRRKACKTESEESSSEFREKSVKHCARVFDDRGFLLGTDCADIEN